MTSREIIKRHLEFQDPERIGLSFSGGRMSDFVSAGLGASPTWQQRKWSEGAYDFYTDEWGNTWYCAAGVNKRGEIYAPALTDWTMLDSYRMPDLAAPARFDLARERFAADAERYRLASLPGFPFAICRYLRKMEVYFRDLILERERIDALHDRVTALLEQIIRRYGAAGADGIFFCEDWGTQERLLVSPAMWREIFKPLYRRLCAAAHDSGLHVLMHSCGYNWEILDDLAKVGVNAFQFDQPALYGLERLAAKLQSLRVCLWAPVDIQTTLPSGDRARITSEAGQMARLFSGRHGGFIAKNYPDLDGIGVQPEWDAWAYEAFIKNQKV